MCVKQVGACEWKAEKQLIKGFTGLISVLSVQNRAAWVFYSPVKQNKWCLYAVFNSSCIYVCIFLDKLAAAACSSKSQASASRVGCQTRPDCIRPGGENTVRYILTTVPQLRRLSIFVRRGDVSQSIRP